MTIASLTTDAVPHTPTEALPRVSYSPEEVAAMTGLTKPRVYGLLRAGQLKGLKVSHRCWVVPSDAITAFLQGQQ